MWLCLLFSSHCIARRMNSNFAFPHLAEFPLINGKLMALKTDKAIAKRKNVVKSVEQIGVVPWGLPFVLLYRGIWGSPALPVLIG